MAGQGVRHRAPSHTKWTKELDKLHIKLLRQGGYDSHSALYRSEDGKPFRDAGITLHNFLCRPYKCKQSLRSPYMLAKLRQVVADAQKTREMIMNDEEEKAADRLNAASALYKTGTSQIARLSDDEFDKKAYKDTEDTDIKFSPTIIMPPANNE